MNAVVKADNPIAVSEITAMLGAIERAAANPDVDVEKMKALLDMQERIFDKRAESAFNVAMNAAQAEMKKVIKHGKNAQTNSKFAKFEDLDEHARPIYTRHGFSLSYDTGDAPAPDTVMVLCYVSHKDGYTRTYKVPMPADGKGAKGGDVMTKTHATGSAIKYGRRYLFESIFNIATGEDDDGNRASDPPINDEQLLTLEARVTECINNKPKFLEWLGVKALADVTVSKYARALAECERQAKAKSKKA